MISFALSPGVQLPAPALGATGEREFVRRYAGRQGRAWLCRHRRVESHRDTSRASSWRDSRDGGGHVASLPFGREAAQAAHDPVRAAQVSARWCCARQRGADVAARRHRRHLRDPYRPAIGPAAALAAGSAHALDGRINACQEALVSGPIRPKQHGASGLLTGRFLAGRRQGNLTVDQRAALEAAVTGSERRPARTMLVERDAVLHQSTMLVEGMMCRYVEDLDGLRQLVALHVPGDFVDLHGYPLRRLDHDVATLSACEVAYVPHAVLDRIIGDDPELGRKLWYSTMLDAAMHRAWLFRLGRLDASGRVAHLLCEIDARLGAVGLSDGRRFALPLTQLDLAEACGLTSVHVNRVLRQLREDRLCTFRHGMVEILDPRGLARRGQFDPDFLYLEDGVAQRLGVLTSAA